MTQKSQRERQSNFFDVCSKCNTNYACCFGTDPPISHKRKRVIERFLKENKIPIKNPFVQGEYVFPRKKAEGYCIFFDTKTKKCQIHPVKPETCVAGPITFDMNTRSQKIEWYVKMESICPLAGIVYKNGELLQKHLEAAKKEILKLVSELSSEELRAILKKEEPETFKIGEDAAGKDAADKLAKK